MSQGIESKLQIFEDRIAVANNTGSSTFLFLNIKSLHVKNAEAYLLKIKTESSAVVCEFTSMHVRDLVKSIILSSINVAENVNKNIISSSLNYKDIFKNLKGIVSNSHLLSSIDKHEPLFFQRNSEVTPENFPTALNQTLIDIFVSMNCTIEQFFNLLMSSYFYNIKNPKNVIDRFLSDKLRGFSTSMDYATRINTASFLNSCSLEEITTNAKKNKSKEVEFEPIYMYGMPEEDLQLDGNFEFRPGPLLAKLDVTDQEESPYFDFNVADLEAARDLCKIVYKNSQQKVPSSQIIDDAAKFSENFINIIEGKYDKEALRYIEKLVPSFYVQK